ncbi:glycosyltransferase [bacterium]|nr:MAG: glycosyltransferase [bacterium]
MISIITGYKNRETSRINRHLESLKNQTNYDFEYILVDYGSDDQYSQNVQSICKQYSFVKYIYTDTKGWLWNRSHALNTGARAAKGDILMFSDVDMIYSTNFISNINEVFQEQRFYQCKFYLLDEFFNKYEDLENQKGAFKMTDEGSKGACQILSKNVFFEIGGFDEFYHIWGREDADLANRLKVYGLLETWIEDRVSMFHQWHRSISWKKIISEKMPFGFWEILNLHFYLSKKDVIRNRNSYWGELYSTKNRNYVTKLTEFNDEKAKYYNHEDLYNEPVAIGKLIQDVQSGYSVCIKKQDLPKNVFKRGKTQLYQQKVDLIVAVLILVTKKINADYYDNGEEYYFWLNQNHEK